MALKSFARVVLKTFTEDVGIPDELIYDNALEQTGPNTDFQKAVRHYHIKARPIEPFMSKHNQAERSIGELRRRWHWLKVNKHVPGRLWPWGNRLIADTMNRTWKQKTGRTSIENVTGETPDITDWLDFGFYDLVWWIDPGDNASNPKLGRWLGVSHRVYPHMAFWVLTSKGQVLSRTSVQVVTEAELKTSAMIEAVTEFNLKVNAKLDDTDYIIMNPDFQTGLIIDDLDHNLDDGMDTAPDGL